MTEPAFINPTLEELDAELSERSFHDFVRASWPILHPNTPFVDSWHIEAMCEHEQAVIDGQINNLLISVAPRHTKSLTGSVDLVPWTWGPHGLSAFSFMYVSFAIHLASDHSVKCRQVIESPWYQRYWGSRFAIARDQNEKTKYANNMMGVRAAFGMGGVAGQGANVVIVDDPHDTKDWVSPTRMKTTVDTYDASIHNRVNDPNNPRRIVIAQRISDRDLSKHLLNQGDWEHLLLPTEYDPKRSKVTVIGWRDPRKRQGELLCPARFSAAQVKIEKEKRPRIFAAQHQQNPSTDEGTIFKSNKWRFYRELPEEMVKYMEVVIQSWDMKFKDAATSSMVAGQVWGKLGANKFLLDRRLEHLGFDASCDAVIEMSRKWPTARAKVIEDKANGPAIMQHLKNTVSGLIPWPPEGEKMDSKIGRAWAAEPQLTAGNLWLPDKQNCPWVEEYIEYMKAFPDAEFNDDTDSTTQALQRLERTPGAGEIPAGVGKVMPWLR
jgi:predicted phage terminase large subunit-like protein